MAIVDPYRVVHTVARRPVLSLLVLLTVLTTFAPPYPVVLAAGIGANVTASPATIVPGSSTTINVVATNGTGSRIAGNLTLTLTDPSGAQVLSRTWSQQRFRKGQLRNYSASYTAPASSVIGAYSARVRITDVGGVVLYDDTSSPFAVVAGFNPSGSIIKVYAAGIASKDGVYPTVSLQIDGVTVATWRDTVGDAAAPTYVEYTYVHTSKVSANRVKVAFTNDYYAADDDDRVLRVDKITVDGVPYESESTDTYSVGSYSSSSGCAGGYKSREWLDCNGYFSYDQQVATTDPTPTFTPLPQPTSGTVMWRGDVEEGNLSDWDQGGGEYNSGTGDSYASQSVVHSGLWSAEQTINTSRGGEHGTRLFRWYESQRNRELYYSAWFYIPQNYRVGYYWNLYQWKSRHPDGRNDPTFILGVQNRTDGSMYLDLFDWRQRVSYHNNSLNLPVGQWVHIEAFYRVDTSATNPTGRVAIWQDGMLLYDVSGVNTAYDYPGRPWGTNWDLGWSLNSYGGQLSPSPVVTYVDDVEIRRP